MKWLFNWIYDNIPVSLIKPIAEYIASPLTFIINNLIEESKFPDQWKIAHVSPIPEVTKPTELNDYRQIFILPIRSKWTKNRLHQITDFIKHSKYRRTPIWLSQKPLNGNHPLNIIWLHQNDYGTKWAYNGFFYRLCKSFWDFWDVLTLIQKMH